MLPVLERVRPWLTSQVGGVGADHDEGEEPPHPRHHPGGDGPAHQHSTCYPEQPSE